MHWKWMGELYFQNLGLATASDLCSKITLFVFGTIRKNVV